MPSFLTPGDFNNNEIRNVLLQNLASDPSGLTSAHRGKMWVNTSDGQAKYWDGAATQIMTQVSGASTNTPNSLVARDFAGNFAAGTITASLTGTASNATQLGGQTLANVRDFSATTGQRTALSAISDFTTAVRANTPSQLATPTTPLAMGSQRITGLADPSTAQDAATKNYVDSVAIGLDIKASVKAGTIAALPSNAYAAGASGVGATLTGTANGALAAVDGYTVQVNDRILVRSEVAAANNGIYTVTQVGTAGTPYILTRATDADLATKVTPGMFTFIEDNSVTLGHTGWVLAGSGSFTIGTTALNFSQFSGGASYTASDGISIVGNAIKVTGTAARISVSPSGVDIASTYVGQSSITTLGTITTGVWTGTAIGLANGGTGASTIGAARTNLKAAGAAAADVPAGSSFAFAHGLGSVDVASVWLREISTGILKQADYTVTDANTVTITFGAAVGSGAYRVALAVAN